MQWNSLLAVLSLVKALSLLLWSRRWHNDSTVLVRQLLRVWIPFHLLTMEVETLLAVLTLVITQALRLHMLVSLMGVLNLLLMWQNLSIALMRECCLML